MKYLAKGNIKGPKGPVMSGEMVELDEKLGQAMVLAGLVVPMEAKQIVEPMEEMKSVHVEEVPQKKSKKGK